MSVLSRVSRPPRLMSRLARWHLRVTGSARDRGDVPGWVLVTVMTAALVSALFLIARPRLTSLLGDALDGVLGG